MNELRVRLLANRCRIAYPHTLAILRALDFDQLDPVSDGASSYVIELFTGQRQPH